MSSSQGPGAGAGSAGGQYTGVLSQLMEKGQLSLDLIKANITELMAGGVDTVCVCVNGCKCVCVRVCAWLLSLAWVCMPHPDWFCVTSHPIFHLPHRQRCPCSLLCLSSAATQRCRRVWGSRWEHHGLRLVGTLRKPCRGRHYWRAQSRRFSGTRNQRLSA